MTATEVLTVFYAIQAITALSCGLYVVVNIWGCKGHQVSWALAGLLFAYSAESAFRLFVRARFMATGSVQVAGWEWVAIELLPLMAMLGIFYVFMLDGAAECD